MKQFPFPPKRCKPSPLRHRKQRRLRVAPGGGALRDGSPVVLEGKERRLVGPAALLQLLAAQLEQVEPEIELAADQQCGSATRIW